MTPAPARRRRRVLLVLFLAFAAFGASAVAAMAGTAPAVASPQDTRPAGMPAAGALGRPASAADTAVLTLGAVTPAVVRPGGGVTVTGTVTARTVALTAPLVRLVVSTTPIVSRADVTAWATNTTFVGGTEVGRVQLGAPVAVGQSVPFSITVPPGKLSLSRAWGSIPLALQVRDPASSTTEVLRTFVGWQRRVEYAQISVAVVAPLTLSPSATLFDSDNSRRSAAWQAELGPTGAIQHLMDGTEADGPAGHVPVTWAVDPAVLGGARGETGPAAGDPLVPVVSPLVTRLSAAAGRHTLWSLPYADTDLAAAVAADPNDATVRAQVDASTSLGRALGVPVATGVAWAVDGSLADGRDAGLRQAYQGPGLDSALVSSSSLPATNGHTSQAARQAPSGLPLLAWDDALSRLAARTTSVADGALATQQLVAETGAILGESPGVARSFLVALPRGTNPDPAALRTMLGTLASTPWVTVVGTDQLRQNAAAQKPAASSRAGTWVPEGAPQLSAAALTRVDSERHVADEIATILRTGSETTDSLRDRWTTALDQITSARWRTAPGELASLERSVTQATATATSGIHVANQTVNFLADEGTMQVTVVNDLPVSVAGVRLSLAPTNPRLVILAQPDPVTIAAGSRAVVPVRARAVSAGLVPVNTALTTPDGTVIGTSSAILVRANPPGTGFYVVSGVIVGLVLVLGIVRTLRRPRRKALVTTPGSASTPPEPDPAEPDPAEPLPAEPDPAASPPVSTDRPVG